MTIKLFSTPYPFSGTKKEILLSALYIGLAVYFFLAVFQPFGTYDFSHPLKYLLLLPYSLIAFLFFTVADLSLKGKTGNWNVGKELLKATITLLICAGFNYWYNSRVVSNTPFSLNSLLSMSVFTLAIGLPICAVYLPAKYIYFKYANNRRPVPAPATAPLSAAADFLYLKATTGSDTLELAKNDFLFAEAEGNYCHIFYTDNGTLHKHLMRTSLKNLEEQVAGADIKRCHRSYIVNLNSITSAKGNSQGYKLWIATTEHYIPVSRKYVSLALPFVQ